MSLHTLKLVRQEPFNEEDIGGFRIDSFESEQIAFVWDRGKRYVPEGVTVEDHEWVFGTSDSKAVATLFVASPLLLAAAIRSLSWLSSYQGGGATEVYDQMRRAIAAAKGEAS